MSAEGEGGLESKQPQGLTWSTGVPPKRQMRENFDRIRVPLHQKREISELEQVREISGPCKSILPTHV